MSDREAHEPKAKTPKAPAAEANPPTSLREATNRPEDWKPPAPRRVGGAPLNVRDLRI